MQPRGKHVAARRRAGRPWTVAIIIGVVVVLAAGGITAGVIEHNHHSDQQAAKKAAAKKVQEDAARVAAVQAAEIRLQAAVRITPAAGAKNVPLDAPIRVTTSLGHIVSVKVTSRSDAVTGTFGAGQVVWTASSSPLQASTTYDVSVTTAETGGITAVRTSMFTTATPTALVSATLWPSSGLSVGVGQPVVVYFSQPIITASAKSGVLAHLKVSMTHVVPGGWYWFSPTELHFRPESFWPSGDQVTLSANLAGWNAGSGEWGTGQESTTFSVGESRISYANLQTEQMTVTENGRVIATYPISGGRPQYPTMDGTHIVLDRETVVHMDSATVGIPVNSPNGYNELVYDDVHISDSGEYVHAAPWSVASQGITNVSHGCINISPSNALQFFNFSRVGDVVVVTGSPRPPVTGDHGVMDWSTPFSQFIPAVVHQA